MQRDVFLLGILLAWPLAGCLGAAPDNLAPDSGGLPPPPALALDEPMRVLGAATREPAVAELPDGTLFVAGSSDTNSPTLWRSRDGGSAWELVSQGGLPAGALGSGDTDLAAGSGGVLYHINILTTTNAGQVISIGASPDGGATWTWNVLSTSPFCDRPWVETAPDGTAHAVWSSPEGLHHARSLDGGASWQEGPLAHPSGGPGGLAIGSEGELAVRVFPLRGPFCTGVVGCGYLLKDAEADGVSVSTDGGASWVFRELPGNRSWRNDIVESVVGDRGGDGTDRWADPVAFDAAGTLYAAWGEGDTLFLARSADLGAAWDIVPIARADMGVAMYAFLRGGAAGELVASWYTGDGDSNIGVHDAHIAHVTVADGPSPLVRAAVFAPESDGGTGGEYFQVLVLRAGGIAAAVPIQDATAQESGFTFLRALRP